MTALRVCHGCQQPTRRPVTIDVHGANLGGRILYACRSCAPRLREQQDRRR